MESSAVSLLALVAFAVTFQSSVVMSHPSSSLTTFGSPKNGSSRGGGGCSSVVALGSSCCPEGRDQTCCPANGVGVYGNCFNANNAASDILAGLLGVDASDICGSDGVCTGPTQCITVVPVSGGNPEQYCCDVYSNEYTGANMAMCNNEIECNMGNQNYNSGLSTDGKYDCCNAETCKDNSSSSK